MTLFRLGSMEVTAVFAAALRYRSAVPRARPRRSLRGGRLTAGEAVAAGAHLLGDGAQVDLELSQLPVAVVVGVPGQLLGVRLGGGDDLLGALPGQLDDALLADQTLGLLLGL